MGLIDSVVEEHSTSFGSVSALTALGSSFLELEDSVSTKYEGRAETLHNQQTEQLSHHLLRGIKVPHSRAEFSTNV